MTTDPSCDDSEQFYNSADGAMPTLGADAGFHREPAAECGGPVWELGGGTGRARLPITAGKCSVASP